MFIKGIERTLTVNSYIPFELKIKDKTHTTQYA